jgi:hypothetical protein
MTLLIRLEGSTAGMGVVGKLLCLQRKIVVNGKRWAKNKGESEMSIGMAERMGTPEGIEF